MKEHSLLNLTTHPVGIFILSMFIIGYSLSIFESKTKLSKEKIMLLIGTLSFIIILSTYRAMGHTLVGVNEEFLKTIEKAVEIYFFLMVAMSFVEIFIEMQVFDVIQDKIISMKNVSYRKIFWIINILTFFTSSVADNLTAIIIGLAILKRISIQKKFLVITSIALIVSSNAGGVWSPFGDITTLIVWSYNKVKIYQFLLLLPAALFGWFVTLKILSYQIANEEYISNEISTEKVKMKKGAVAYIIIFILTIIIAAIFRMYVDLPPFWAMLFGLALASFWSYFTTIVYDNHDEITSHISVIDHDTLLFFLGLISIISALNVIGYFDKISILYNIWPKEVINIIIGLLSSLIDNSSLVTAVMNINPSMDLGMWLLLTLTSGIGGSIVTFGSAAGIGVLNGMDGVYTISDHIKYSWVILLGFALSVGFFMIQYKIFF